jgi:hypothetical protein
MTDYRTAAHEAIARAHAATGIKWGHIPDADHLRTQKSSTLRFFASPTVPDFASVSDFEADVMDQGNDASCGGHGTAQCIASSAGAAGIAMPVPSPWYLYALARIMGRGTAVEALTDSGIQPSWLLQALPAYGVMPFFGPSPDGRYSDVWSAADTGDSTKSNVTQEPDLLSLERGGMKLLTGEYRIDETAPNFAAQIQACVAGVGGKPASVGIGIFVDVANFMRWDPSKGPINTIDLTDPNGGGHWLALTYYYKTLAGALVFGGPNSWSKSWPGGSGPSGSPFWRPGHYEITATCLKTVASDILAFPIKVIA